MKEKYSNERKKYKMLLVVSIVVGLILIGVGTYFYWFTGDNKTNSQEEDETPAYSEEYDNWVNYLLNQNITTISLSEYCDMELENDCSTGEITIEELTSTLNKLINSKYTKNYEADLGVPTSGKYLSINYIKNGLEYSVYLEEFRIRGEVEDTNLKALLDKNKTDEIRQDICTSEEDCMYAYYFDTSW